MLTASRIPNQTRSMPSLSATGASSGTMMNESSKKSRKKARTKTSRLTTIRKPAWPPGSPSSRCSTQRSPLTPRKIRPKTVEPTRMKTTKDESLPVVSMACLSSFHDRRLRPRARISAPVAPMAPPSVGVAMPRKMVPRTRKMSSSGGTSAVSTRSSSLKPCRVRASAGSAGQELGLMMLRIAT